jgi:fatty acid desaturase
MQPDIPLEELRQLIKDARRAIWLLAIVNVFVLLIFFVDGIFNEFVVVALFVQCFLFTVWLLPVFYYQVFFKKFSAKYALYKALASYKEALGHVSW